MFHPARTTFPITDQPILPRCPASAHITDSQGPWSRLLPLLLAPVSPLLHPRRCRALAAAALVVTRSVWRMRGTSCPQEAYRGKLSKLRLTGTAAAASPLSSSSTSPSAGVPLPVAGVQSSALASWFCLFHVPDFLRRQLIIPAFSSSRFSERGFRLRAVSLRCSASEISASFSCFRQNVTGPNDTHEHRLTCRQRPLSIRAMWIVVVVVVVVFRFDVAVFVLVNGAGRARASESVWAA